MFLSIITITYNDLDNLKNTLKSIEVQDNKNFEWIVVDGNSKDGTKNFIEHSEYKPSTFISEPDAGLYDAMNKGIKAATGNYLVFMNAGDTFPDTTTVAFIEKQIIKNNLPDFVYGDAFEIDVSNNKLFRPSRKSSHKVVGMFTHHQSMYYKSSLIKEHDLTYDLSLKIAADYKFTCQFLELVNTELYIPSPLCIFLQGGLSQVEWKQSMKELSLVKKEVLNMPSPQVYILYISQLGWHLLKNKIPAIYKYIRFKNMKTD